jgi:hypothetical protein
MTTENDVVTDTATDPVIDQASAEQAKREAEQAEREAAVQAQGEIDMAAHEAMLAEMANRIEEEKIIAAEQDAALAAVKAECDAYRAALNEGGNAE